MKREHVLIFNLQDYHFALNLQYVREVVHIAELIKPPGTPAFIDGFLNLENAALPVMSLSQLFFSIPYQPRIYTPLILIQTPELENPWALIVENVIEIKVISDTDLLPVNEELIFTNCVTGVIENNKKKTYLLDPRQILLKQEEERISEFQQLAQKRIDNTKSGKRKHKQNE